MVRLRLAALGLQVTPQVPIGRIGRVDLLVGERLVIEVDSIEHHTTLENYRNDRWRDLRLAALGYRVIRLTYHQVIYDWPETAELIGKVIARGDHLWRSGR
ncbi:endonuclease domain-containing protein [Enemella sp. A6]|uniref:endonuclease domain-containing protein n=1 Tax=Enemella sp. A6 TaxID=3440152 RepID=UPI003EBBC304